MKTQLKSMKPRMFHFIKNLKCSPQGFTIAETMMVLAVIFIVSTGTLGFYINALRAGGSTKYLTAATYTAREHLEEIRTTSFENITTLFPEGTFHPIDGTSLPSGATWSVTYPDGTNANLLTITVIVSWSENGQTQSVQLTTQVKSPSS